MSYRFAALGLPILLAACGQQQGTPLVSPDALHGHQFLSAEPGLPAGHLMALSDPAPSVTITPSCLPINYNSSVSGALITRVSGFSNDTAVRFVISSGFAGNLNFGNYALLNGATTIRLSWIPDPFAVEYTFKMTGTTSGVTAATKQVSIDPANPDVTCSGAAPTVSTIQVPATITKGQLTVPLSAVVSDVQRGNSLIASAEYSVDGGAWATMNTVTPDALFNAVTETVQATVPLPDVVGRHAVCVRGTDAFGLTSDGTTCSTVTIAYPFSGFQQPVDPMPTLNDVKAGSSVPLKFSLGSDAGLAIFALGSPSSQQVPCGSTTLVGDLPISTVTAGSSSLAYDPLTTQYTYVWKTDPTWAGTCRLLSMTLIDTKTYQAAFKFK